MLAHLFYMNWWRSAHLWFLDLLHHGPYCSKVKMHLPVTNKEIMSKFKFHIDGHCSKWDFFPVPLHGVTDRIILKPEIDPFGSEAIKMCRLRAKLTSFPENRWRWLEKVPVESIADLAHHYWTCTRPHHSLRIASCYTQWLIWCIFSYFGICGLHRASYKNL